MPNPVFDIAGMNTSSPQTSAVMIKSSSGPARGNFPSIQHSPQPVGTGGWSSCSVG